MCEFVVHLPEGGERVATPEELSSQGFSVPYGYSDMVATLIHQQVDKLNGRSNSIRGVDAIPSKVAKPKEQDRTEQLKASAQENLLRGLNASLFTKRFAFAFEDLQAGARMAAKHNVSGDLLGIFTPPITGPSRTLKPPHGVGVGKKAHKRQP
jgi:hypothetical protein